MSLPLTLTHEPVADVPILWHLLHERLQLGAHFDTLHPPHGNWLGLSPGTVLELWLVHILSTHTHHLSHVREWANRLRDTLSRLVGQSVRETDFTDDRLAELCRWCSVDTLWQGLEQQLTQAVVRVYALTPQTVRLDATTAKVYSDRASAVLFQRGQSKDHRPDLRQFKVMLAALDPLGVWVAVDVVSGQRADDPLYVPLIERVRTALPAQGLLYVGDCKMSALATRAHVQHTQNYYLMPLARVGQVPVQLCQWIDAAVQGQVPVVALRAATAETLLGQGYELTRTQTADLASGSVTWSERVLLVQAHDSAQQATRALHARLDQACAALRALTPPRGRGQRPYSEAAPLRAAAHALLQRYAVAGLLRLDLRAEVDTQTRRAYRGQPARTLERHRYVLQVSRNHPAISAHEKTLGWRAYAPNAPATHLPLVQALETYRDEWLVERNPARLKGRSLSLTPLWMQREDHALGLTRIVSIAARALALIEFEVRRSLQAQQQPLAGLYAGQATRQTERPTSERLLKAFASVQITTVQSESPPQRLLTPLTPLQHMILALLKCPPDLYARLAEPS